MDRKVYRMGGREGIADPDEGDDDKTQFSIRLPNKLLKQITDRMAVSKRSRNKEIEYLVTRQIEADVERDQEIVRRMAEKNSTLRNNQS